MPHELCLVLDFGAQYAQLIARRIRECGVYCRIVPYNISAANLKALRPQALVLSGGPASVLAEGAPHIDPAIFDLGLPVLGICYGQQLMGKLLGGQVTRAKHREYGHAELQLDPPDDPLFHGVAAKTQVWMSHGDSVTKLPPGFQVAAHTGSAPFAAIADPKRKFAGVQFHPEVTHTPEGKKVLDNFLKRYAGFKGDWKMGDFIAESTAAIRQKVGADKVILGLSGGVDSSVAAVLIHEAIGAQLQCIFIDNGVLRKNEAGQVEKTFRDAYRIPLKVIDAGQEFLSALAGVLDPERKRKIIGEIFVRIFEREARQVAGAKFLAQGTLYPDVIESVAAHGGPTSVIKSHHNVGGLPADLKLQLLEPFRELFKDEVRAIGRQLKLPETIVGRQPFPGPGLAVRIVGEVTAERVAILQNSDVVVEEEIRAAGLYEKLWQSFAVLLPVKSVGVQGDERTYAYTICLRAVESTDGMTADWADLPRPVLMRISNRIINEVDGVNRVVYDISSKPPATIEWE